MSKDKFSEIAYACIDAFAPFARMAEDFENHDELTVAFIKRNNVITVVDILCARDCREELIEFMRQEFGNEEGEGNDD